MGEAAGAESVSVKFPRRVPGALVAAGVLLVLGMIWMARQGGRRPQVDLPSILLQVRQMNQLTTVRYTVQKVIGITEQKQLVGSEAILLIVQARVEAGVDLAGLRQEDVTVRVDGTVVVRLPVAKVLNVTVDEAETKVWDRTKTWWTPWVPYGMDLEQRARRAGVEAIEKAALEMGILGQAERNAETSIRGLLVMAGVKEVLVVPGGRS